MKVVFAHNVQIRHEVLRNTIEIERTYFPDSKIYVAYNDDNFNVKYFDDLENIIFTKYIGEGHKLGCVNGCITSIQSSLDDDYDVLVFTHDDVSINKNYYKNFEKRILEIYNEEYEIICRKPDSHYGANYALMEGFFISKKAVINNFKGIKLLKSNSELPHDIRNSPSPEVWLHNQFNKRKNNIIELIYVHTTNNYNFILAQIFGLFHKNAGIRGWK